MSMNPIREVTDYLEAVTNECGQRIGLPVADWNPASKPKKEPLEGRFAHLVPLEPKIHADELYESVSIDGDHESWTYMHYGPFRSSTEFRIWMAGFCSGTDPLFYSIIDKADGQAKGFASYQRINPEQGTIEVGHVYFGPRLRRTAAATEAMYLMMHQAFQMGYRRCEWKCDAQNVPSHRAARRFGFTYEGTFRQGGVYKGRNRDISWYSIVDSEWEWLRRAFEEWLGRGNMDGTGKQLAALGDCILRSSPIPIALDAPPVWLI
jgi:RimJ/RimL family protein N-acetyltransferase